jgi:hypothetical protein
MPTRLLELDYFGMSQSLAVAFLEEFFTRNVRWALAAREGDHGELAVLEPDGSVSEYRLSTTLAASATAVRLLLFQCFCPGRPGAIKRPWRFPLKIFSLWHFCMGAQGAKQPFSAFTGAGSPPARGEAG